MKPSVPIDRFERRAGKLKKFYDRVSALLFRLSLFRLIAFSIFVLWISVFYYFRSSFFYYLPSLLFLFVFYFLSEGIKRLFRLEKKFDFGFLF
ncbi:hypothetical protein LEP1GSC161_1568 [Leptospira santarosai str. CBC1416]|uniref:Uncharacterized protein n=1 Tax=Leptospira santarosai str. CBC1416 TaxID=1193059 RepID=M6VN27_9LEPT|nr:hypothetical protein LEP1GSC161_1568 [Leptospira santarosai str. CBC1416]